MREPGAGSSGSASRLTPETGHAQGLDTAAPDIWQFSYDRWKHKFPRRVIQSAVVPLPSDFVAFLLQDGVNIPGDVYNHFEVSPPPARQPIQHADVPHAQACASHYVA